MDVQHQPAAEGVQDFGREESRPQPQSLSASEKVVSILIIPAPDQLETPVRLTIDNVPVSTTVGEIRRRAQAMIASQPELSRLRLIHSGRLLVQDEQTLEHIVGSEAIYVNRTIPIHLILKPLPGTSRTLPLTRTGSPANAGNGQPTVFPGQAPTPFQHPAAPLLQPAPIHGFPPRPSSTPAMPHAQGPYAVPVQGAGPNGFAAHGVPNQQQAQFMQQLQQQHLNMMHAILRHGPQHGPQAAAQQAHQMTLPDFQRMYNQQAQARHVQQTAPSGRATPTGPLGRSAAPSIHADSQGGPEMTALRSQYQRGRIFNDTRVPELPTNELSRITTSLSGRNAENDTIFLLSSPSGHEAILFGRRSSQDSLGDQGRILSGTTAGQTAPEPDSRERNFDGDRANEPVRNAEGERPVQPRDLMAIVMPLGGQLWLLVRLAGVVALLTLNATWSRTLIIWLIALIIYLAQTEVLRPVQQAVEQVWVPVRRHIEDLVRDVEQQPAAPGQHPDPVLAAERLLRQQRDQGMFRRVERSLALFVASFVPGVGEAQVAARESAERRRRREAREREEEAMRAQQQRDSTGAQESRIEEPSTTEGPAMADTGPSTHREESEQPVLRNRQPHVEEADE